jgi:transketolase
MRNAFVDELVRLAGLNSHIALVVGDLGYSVTEPFANRFPDCFINAGVAEQNMTGLAAGMASEGYHVFTYSIANFPTFRCAEQIRNDVDYLRMPVTIVAVGGGLGYGPLGYSHHAIQDYALMRVMPSMLICSPGDPLEVRACLRYLIANPQPSYLRLGKAGEPLLHGEIPSIMPGRWVKVHSKNIQSDVAIVATGGALSSVFSWMKDPVLNHIDLYSMPLWGMRYKSMQALQAKRYKHIITIEDHLADAGFGSWMCEALFGDGSLQPRLTIMALDDQVCGIVGSQNSLNKIGGLSLDRLKSILASNVD